MEERLEISARVRGVIRALVPTPLSIRRLLSTINDLNNDDYQTVLLVTDPNNLYKIQAEEFPNILLRIMLELAVVLHNNTVVSLIINKHELDLNGTDALELAAAINNNDAVCSLLKGGAIPSPIIEQFTRLMCPFPIEGNPFDKGMCHDDMEAVSLEPLGNVNDVIVLIPEDTPDAGICVSRSILLAWLRSEISLQYGDCRGDVKDLEDEPDNYCRKFRKLPHTNQFIFNSMISLIENNPRVNVWILNKYRHPILMGRWLHRISEYNHENESVLMLEPSSADTYTQDVLATRGGRGIPLNEFYPAGWVNGLPPRDWIFQGHGQRPNNPDELDENLIEAIENGHIEEALSMIEENMPIEYYVQIAKKCLESAYDGDEIPNIPITIRQGRESPLPTFMTLEYRWFSPIIRRMIIEEISPNELLYFISIMKYAFELYTRNEIPISRIKQLLYYISNDTTFYPIEVMLPNIRLLFDVQDEDTHQSVIISLIGYFELLDYMATYIFENMINFLPLPEDMVFVSYILNRMNPGDVLEKVLLERVVEMYHHGVENAILYINLILQYLEEGHGLYPPSIQTQLEETMTPEVMRELLADDNIEGMNTILTLAHSMQLV